MPKRNIITKINQNPAYRQGALLFERMQKVRKQGVPTMTKKFFDNFRKIFYNNYSGDIKIYGGIIERGRYEANIFLQHSEGDSKNIIGRLSIVITKRNGKLELFVKEIQGKYGLAEEIKKFNEANKEPWSKILIKNTIDAAYHSGFDRVLLLDITTSSSYLDPFVFDHFEKGMKRIDIIRERKRVRENMKSIYNFLKKEGSFTKEEWIDKKHYWVREFP